MIIRSENIWAGRGRVFHDGGIRIEHNIISEIGPFRDMTIGEESVNDLRDAIIVPAFINPLTHLGLASEMGKGETESTFARWIRATEASSRATPMEARAVRKGLSQCVKAGVAAVGDISMSGESAVLLQEHGLKESVVFLEVFGLEPDDAQPLYDTLKSKIDSLMRKTTIRLGIAPHSTYTVSPELFELCVKLSEEYNLPIAVHAAESEDEIEFLTTGYGELPALLDRYKLMPHGKWWPPGKRPIAYLEDLGVLGRKPMLINSLHMNYDEAAKAADYECTVAFSPRTTAAIHDTADALETLFEGGVRVAIGTDDYGSMLSEMVYIKQRHPDISWETILEMTTQNAALALGIRHGGVLEVGAPADIIAISSAGGRDLSSQILNKNAEIVFSYRGGERLARPHVAPVAAGKIGQK